MLEIVVVKPALVWVWPTPAASVKERVPELIVCGEVLNAVAFKVAVTGLVTYANPTIPATPTAATAAVVVCNVA